jgi:excisionase family DNA binding protein
MMSLRRACCYLLSLRCAWTAQECAQLAECEVPAAKAFLARLKKNGVVAMGGGEGHYKAGSEAARWMREKPKTRPGGHAKGYLKLKALREELAARDWQAARAGPLTCQESSCAHTGAQECAPAQEGEAMDAMLTVERAAQLLSVSAQTVRRWGREGHIVLIRVGPSVVRVPPAEIARLSGGHVKV